MPALSSDTQFERTFSDLAFASLQDKAPALLDYLVGFQVLDVNEDQTKAVGVFGTKVGEEWVYLPVFFLNGELKGTELMYLKNQDIFVPLQEPWVQYILNRKPHKMGETSEITMRDLAGTGVDLLPFRSSPRSFGKTADAVSKNPDCHPCAYLTKKGHKRGKLQIPLWAASTKQAWTAPIVDALERLPKGEGWEKSANSLDLCNFMGEIGPRFTKSIVQMMIKEADFGNSVMKHYPIEKITGIKFEKQAADLGPGKTNLPDVRITSYKELSGWDNETLGFSDEDRERLLKGELVVKDHRRDTSQVYKATIPQTAQSPNETGVYKVLTAEGDLVRCLIIVSPLGVSKYGDEEDEGAVVTKQTSSGVWGPEHRSVGAGRPKRIKVINLEGEGCWKGKTDEIFTRPEPRGFWSFTKEQLSQLKDPTSIEEGKAYAIVTPSGSGTTAFCVLKKLENADGNISLYVDDNLMPGDYSFDSWHDSHQILLQKDYRGRMRKMGDTIFVPDHARVVEIKLPNIKKDKHGYYDHIPEHYGFPKPADPKHVEQMWWKNGVVTPMKLYSSGTEYAITVGETDYAMKSAGMITHRSALDQLVHQHGINGDKALGMLKEARALVHKHEAAKFLIKYSEGYPNWAEKRSIPNVLSLTPGPGGPAVSGAAPVSTDPYVGVPVQPAFSYDRPIDSLRPPSSNYDLYNPDIKRDTNIYEMVNRAAQTGQKEVFDTAVVGGLIKAIDVDSLIDKYIGDLILGMDRVGRIYFLFLQHNDNFSDRYGQEDMVELEDSLKNTFRKARN